MQQRRVRLGDILDDYCPRERRITNHAVVAMIEDEVKQTRCTTCDADHEYLEAKVPAPRKKPEASLVVPGTQGLPLRILLISDPEPPVVDEELIEGSIDPSRIRLSSQRTPTRRLRSQLQNRASPKPEPDEPASRTNRTSGGASTADSNAAQTRRPDAGAQSDRFHDSSERRPVRRSAERQSSRERDRLTDIHPANDSATRARGPDSAVRPRAAPGQSPGPRAVGSVAVVTPANNEAEAVLAVTADVDQVEDRSADDDRFLGQIWAHRRRRQ